jgi:hypothetical protein
MKLTLFSGFNQIRDQLETIIAVPTRLFLSRPSQIAGDPSLFAET